jgi:TRAP-type C4-dicarboxylate transport system substrate-binding protein
MNYKKFLTALIFSFFLTNSYAVTLKIATLSPDGTNWMKKMRAGAKKITEQTNNRVKFKFYPGGVMGNDQAVLKKIRIGQLHGGAVTGGTLIPYYPDSEVYNIALTFESEDEVEYVRKHLDKDLIKELEKGGFVIFGIAESGFSYIMSKEPILSVADLARQKVWVPAGDENAIAMVENFSITPIPLPVGDVLAGLQTGLINTVAISPIGALALQWHTQVKNITDMPLLFGYGTLAISTRAFKKIKKADQEIVRKVFTETFREIDAENKKDNIAAMQALRNQGINFVKPSTEQLSEWKTMTNVATQKLIDSGKLNKKAVDRINKLITQYRKNKK